MLRLTYHADTRIPVEAECVTPDNLAGKSPREIAHLSVQHGNTSAPLGEFFKVEGDADDGDVVVEGDTSRVKWLGAGMSRGLLTITGDAGMHTGAEMTGGTLTVRGNTGDWVGAEMCGGTIHVHGNAGHLVGAAYRGAHVGMRGGVILVRGTAGNEVGAGMRRGLIAVGAAADFVGVSMVAGSVFVFGPSGQRPGAGMKRGTLVFAGPPPQTLVTFRQGCVYEPVFLAIYLRRLASWGYPVPTEVFGARWRRHSGDLVSLGKGEILTREV
ncbi:MAG: formylmethanofuran dehydrogenase subunit C [Gemmataceae bacterium]